MNAKPMKKYAVTGYFLVPASAIVSATSEYEAAMELKKRWLKRGVIKSKHWLKNKAKVKEIAFERQDI